MGGEDAIARNIASRIWNIASATTENSGVVLYDSEELQDMDVIFVLASEPLPESAAPVATITLAECTNLSQRIRTAIAASMQSLHACVLSSLAHPHGIRPGDGQPG